MKVITNAYKTVISWANIKCRQKCVDLFYRNFLSYVIARNYFSMENNSIMAEKPNKRVVNNFNLIDFLSERKHILCRRARTGVTSRTLIRYLLQKFGPTEFAVAF
jgi:hypothetical protein